MWALTDFRIERPLWTSTQEQTFAWLARAYSEARPAARDRMPTLVRRFGCAPPRIQSRGHEIRDFHLTEWDEMEVYRLHEFPSGVPLNQRMAVFAKGALRAFRALYDSPDHPPPHEILHVTCTGYASPSPGQRFCESRGWGSDTRVSQLYHSGCYASIPAVRQAIGAALATQAGGAARPKIDIVHTEMCSLHLDPLNPEPEQIVVHSLFADGNIRYSLRAHSIDQRGLLVRTTLEEIVPNTAAEMQWLLEPSAFRMHLSRSVPDLLASAIESFVKKLGARAGVPLNDSSQWAIHPGGPRILEVIQDKLRLNDSQLEHSRAVLAAYGNMSSATLPHIWESILADPSIPVGTRVPSLAFGPGLTLAGLVLEKV